MRVVGAWLLVIAILISIVWWLVELPWVVTNALLIDRALALLSIVSALLVLLSLFLTIDQFRTTQKQLADQQHAQHISQLDAVIMEIEINQTVCAEIAPKPVSLDGPRVPESKFHVAILERTLANGTVGNESIRRQLWNACRYMNVTNSLLARALDVLYMEHSTDPRVEISRMGRVKRTNLLINEATAYVENIAEVLADVRPKLERLRSC